VVRRALLSTPLLRIQPDSSHLSFAFARVPLFTPPSPLFDLQSVYMSRARFSSVPSLFCPFAWSLRFSRNFSLTNVPDGGKLLARTRFLSSPPTVVEPLPTGLELLPPPQTSKKSERFPSFPQSDRAARHFLSGFPQQNFFLKVENAFFLKPPPERNFQGFLFHSLRSPSILTHSSFLTRKPIPFNDEKMFFLCVP